MALSPSKKGADGKTAPLLTSAKPDGAAAAAKPAPAAAAADEFSFAKLNRATVLFTAVPSFFDLLVSTLGFIGLVFINASEWQILRGAQIIFSSIFSILFLNRVMLAYNWIGVGVCMTGLMMVGVAGFLSAQERQAAAFARALPVADVMHNSEASQNVTTGVSAGVGAAVG